jgi:hypothetical protein
MEAIFKIEPKEFNEELFLRLKKLFKGKTVTIAFSTEIDETSYLTMNPVNEKYLLESIVQEPIIRFTPEEFKEKISEL